MAHTTVFVWEGEDDNRLLGMADNKLAELADQVLEFAERAVPVDTGALQLSLKRVKDGDSDYRVGSSLRYAAPVELGYHHHQSGRFIPAQPYLRPALDAARATLE